jgi:hypothetical protein
MTLLQFILSGICLGLLDSLNPFSIAAMVGMLSREMYVRTGLGFLIGTLFTYFLGGVAVLFGWNSLARSLGSALPLWVIHTAIIGLALGLVYHGVRLWQSTDKPDEQKSSLIQTGSAAFVFGAVSTGMDLSSALPFFVYLGRLPGLNFSPAIDLVFVMTYVLIYVAPLVLLFFIRFRMSDSSQILIKMKSWVFTFERRVLPPILFLSAVVLIIYVILNLTGVL